MLSCAGCRRTLPVRPPTGDEPLVYWECEHCGEQFAGALLQRAAQNLAERVRLAQSHFDARLADAIPDPLRNFVAQSLERRRLKQKFDPRRRQQRAACDFDAVLLELDERWLPIGRPVNAVVIDLAAHGLGLVMATPVRAATLAMQIACPSGPVQLIGRHAWFTMVGDGFQNSGVQFTLRLGRRWVAEQDIFH